MLPFMPLARWVHWPHWRYYRRREIKNLALLLATSLRESFEEMRLNPLMTRFLGPMPSQNLDMFSRVLYPMVVWIHQKHFCELEVERYRYSSQVCSTPETMLVAGFFRPTWSTSRSGIQGLPLLSPSGRGREVLWGVTYGLSRFFANWFSNSTP
jgi:hypothetical protein